MNWSIFSIVDGSPVLIFFNCVVNGMTKRYGKGLPHLRDAATISLLVASSLKVFSVLIDESGRTCCRYSNNPW